MYTLIALAPSHLSSKTTNTTYRHGNKYPHHKHTCDTSLLFPSSHPYNALTFFFTSLLLQRNTPSRRDFDTYGMQECCLSPKTVFYDYCAHNSVVSRFRRRSGYAHFGTRAERLPHINST